MINENKYPTMRFMICKKCGNVFASSFSGAQECPDCSSEDTAEYNPEDHTEDDDSLKP